MSLRGLHVEQPCPTSGPDKSPSVAVNSLNPSPGAPELPVGMPGTLGPPPFVRIFLAELFKPPMPHSCEEQQLFNLLMMWEHTA